MTGRSSLNIKGEHEPNRRKPMEHTDENIKKDVVDDLYWDNRIDASEINVTVDNGLVTLSGQVATYGERSVARDPACAAGTVPGGGGVG
jgi:osmotically-inducible protein OsmY